MSILGCKFKLSQEQIIRCIADYYHIPDNAVTLETALLDNEGIVANVDTHITKWLCRDLSNGSEFIIDAPWWLSPGTMLKGSLVIVSELVEEDNHEDSVHTD